VNAGGWKGRRMARMRLRQQGLAVGFSVMVTAALLVGAGQWEAALPSVTDGKTAPGSDPRPELQPSPPPGSGPERPPERDPARFYRKPPRERKPRTEMFAQAAPTGSSRTRA
jgi:hypothetical protein